MKQLGSGISGVIKLITPPTAFSWQTLILLSLFSCAMAALATEIARELLSNLGWIFLILGVGWLTIEYPPKIAGFSVGPWITGALTSIFIFGRIFDRYPSVMFISWPLISAAIAAIREFVTPPPDTKFKQPNPEGRQRLVILILSNLVISCWFQFYFLLQDWFQQYPTLLAEDLSKSAFISSFNLQARPVSKGAIILSQAQALAVPQIEGRPWPEVEQWLFNIKQQPQTFSNQVLQEFLTNSAKTQRPASAAAIGEDIFWRIEPRILPGEPYTFQVLAIWTGPAANPQGYYLSKSCPIKELAGQPNPAVRPNPGAILPATISIGKITCGEVSGAIPGQPPPLPQ